MWLHPMVCLYNTYWGMLVQYLLRYAFTLLTEVCNAYGSTPYIANGKWHHNRYLPYMPPTCPFHSSLSLHKLLYNSPSCTPHLFALAIYIPNVTFSKLNGEKRCVRQGLLNSFLQMLCRICSCSNRYKQRHSIEIQIFKTHNLTIPVSTSWNLSKLDRPAHPQKAVTFDVF